MMAVQFTKYDEGQGFYVAAFPMAAIYYLMFQVCQEKSGSMFNPAIVLAEMLIEDGTFRGRGKEWSGMLGYYVLGGLAGTAIGYFTFHSNTEFDMFTTVDSDFQTLFTAQQRMLQVIFLEFICSSLFIGTYLMINNSPSCRTEDNNVKALTMSMALIVCIFLSGGSESLMNPAFILVQIILQTVILLEGGNQIEASFPWYKWGWINFVVPLIAAWLMAKFFRDFHLKKCSAPIIPPSVAQGGGDEDEKSSRRSGQSTKKDNEHKEKLIDEKSE